MTTLDRNDCTKIVQCAQATRSTRDLILLRSFSTRFSTELLKTFTLHSYLVLVFACHLVRKLHCDFFSKLRATKYFLFISKAAARSRLDFVSFTRVMIRRGDA